MRHPTAVRICRALVVCGVFLAACSSASSTASSSTPPNGESTSTATGVEPSPSSSSFSATGSPVPSTTVDGKWNGTWKGDSGGSGTFSVDFSETGSSLKGTLSISVSCLDGAKVTGKVNGDSIQFGSVKGQCSVDYKGTIKGDRMSGTYGLGDVDAGTWKASKA
jgi:hypothetical protein